MRSRTEKNWVLWLGIEIKVGQAIKQRWFNQEIAKDVLAGAMEYFVRLNKSDEAYFSYAWRQALRSARDQGYLGDMKRKEKEPTAIPAANLAPILESDCIPDHRPSAVDLLLEAEEEGRIALIIGLLSPALQKVVEAIRRGCKFGEAAKAAGLSNSELSREIAWIRQKGGKAPCRSAHKKQDTGSQLALF